MLCHRLGDPDIRLDLLSGKNQDMTLENMSKFVEVKENGKALCHTSPGTPAHICTLREHIPLQQEGVSQGGPCTSPQGASDEGQG